MRDVKIHIEPSDDGRFNVVETVVQTVITETRTVAAIFIEELHAEWFRMKLEGQPKAKADPIAVTPINMPSDAWGALEEDYRLSTKPDFDVSWNRLLERAKFEGWDLLPKDIVRGFFFDDLQLLEKLPPFSATVDTGPDAPTPLPPAQQPNPPTPVEEQEPIAAEAVAASSDETLEERYQRAYGMIADGASVKDAADRAGVVWTNLRSKWAGAKAEFMKSHRSVPQGRDSAAEQIVDELSAQAEDDQGSVSGGVGKVLSRSKPKWTKEDDDNLEAYEIEVGIVQAAKRLKRSVEDCSNRLKALDAVRQRQVAREMAQ